MADGDDGHGGGLPLWLAPSGDVDGGVAREAEAWKIAQLAATIAAGYAGAGKALDLQEQIECVKMSEFILGFSRERVASKRS